MENKKSMATGLFGIQADSTLKEVRRFSYQYIVDVQHVKTHRSVLKIIREQRDKTESEKIKAECNEVIAENEHTVKQLLDKLAHELKEAEEEKARLQEYLKKSEYSYEWVDINEMVGLYIHKISKIKEVL